jgi:ribose transport system substrate-binding protein
LVPVCKQAVDAGIVVVNIDNKLDSGALAEKNLKIPFVGPDNRAGARWAGEHLAKKVRAAQPAGTIEVAIIEGKKGAFNAEQRRLGFEDAMKAANITVATSQSANWETDQANALVGPILTANGNIKAFLCANDSMALGVAAAIRNNPQWKQKGIFVVGFDNIAAARELIKNGSMLCSVDQHADQIAVNGIEYALQIIAKQAAPADRQTPVDLVTAESLKK